MTAGPRRLLLPLVTLCTLGALPFMQRNELGADSCSPEAPPGNYGIDLDGQGSHIDLGAAPGLNGTVFTLEAWVRRQGPGLATGTGAVQAIPILTRGRDEAGSEGNNLDLNWFLGLRAADGVLVADFEDDATGANHPAAGTTAIPLDAWTHVAATYDGGTWRLYVNGALETTLAVGATPRADALAQAAIGTAFDSTGVADGWFDGVVDEPRVWSVARTDGDIAAGMVAAISGAAGLAGRWGLDEGIGTVALDSSGGLNHGTLSAGAWVRGTPFVPQAEPLVDHALAFAGASHVAFDAAASLGLSTFTIEAWFNRRGPGAAISTGTDGVVAIPLAARGRDEGEADATDLNWFLGLRAADGVLVADFEDADTGANHPVAGTTPVPSGRWNHAAAVFDGATWRLYLNGVLEAETPAAFTPRADSLAHAALGTALDSTGAPAGFFDGSLDEVRLWSVARSGAEIQDGLKREITTGTGLVARYGLSEGTGAAIGDAQHPGAPAGTVVSADWVDGVPFADRLVVTDDTCDGIDQDCDGVPDDGYQPVSCGTTDVGACALGTSTCTTGTIGCSGSIEPATEVCDGVDNDCDGATDEGLGTLNCGTGICAATVPACAGGVPQTCVPGTPQTGTSLSFDGVDDDVDFGSHASITTFGTQSFTVEEWFKATDAGPFAGLFRTGRQGSWAQVAIQMPGNPPFNRLTVSVESNSQEQVDTAPVDINLNQWYHVAAVVDRSINEVRVYLDGALVATADASFWGGATIGDNFYSTLIGAARRSDDSLGNFFSGAIDELRVWNYARTLPQIQQGRFQAIATAPGLLARWSFDAGAGTQAIDSVSGGARNTGTLTNGVTWVPESGMGVEAVCDGLDNDCDGLVDEDYQPVPTTCGTGPCVATGVTSCVNGTIQDSCIPNPGAPSDASCNDVDDDCDGLVDDDFVSSPVRCGTGACGAVGQTSCVLGIPGNDCTPGRPAANYGLDLDGGGSYVTFGPAPSLGLPTFTVEAWFKRHGEGIGADTGVNGLSEAAPIVTKGRGEADGSPVDMNYYLGVSISTGKLQADFEDMATGGNHPIVGTTPTEYDTWYHAAFTYDGTTTRLYLNGVLDGQRNEGGATPRFDTAQHSAIGTAINSLGQAFGWFDGVVDEARIWDHARTDEEILADMSHPVLAGDGLVARWGLDETGGTTIHNSVGTVHGALTNGSFVTGTPFASGPSANPDHAAKFDGYHSHVNIPPSASLGLTTFTVETWFNRKWLGDYTDTGGGGVEGVPLVAKGRGEADGDNRDVNYFIGLRYFDNRLIADFEDTEGGVNHPLVGSTLIPEGTWNHVAAVYDGAVWRLYLNGRLEAIQQLAVTPRFDSIQPVGIGSALDSTGVPLGFFAGEMNETRIWNVARTAAEIQDGMRRQILAAPGLVGRWGLTEGTGTTIADTAGSPAHDGTLVLGTWTDGYPFTNKPVVTDVTCDNVDDDCDGQVDEDLGTISCGIGACQVTTPACVNGQLESCSAGTPAPESCDNLDNDCDGTTDEDLGVVSCGVGACAAAAPACVNGAAGTCTPGTPGEEVCNGIDDDCDGTADEGLQPLEATNLVFTNPTTLTWSAAPQAVSHSLYRGSVTGGAAWTWNEVCLENNLASPTAQDIAVPPIGTAYYYFAVGRNACGDGSIGVDSAGQPRPTPPPCP